MSDRKVSIIGLDNKILLEALWMNSKSKQTIGLPDIGDFHEFGTADLRDALKCGYVDYFQGRLIKIDFSQDEVDPSEYDNEFGKGAFASVVAAVKGK